MYEKFEKLLIKNDVSVYKVSKLTGISSVTFTDWKQGKYTPKIDKLQRVASYFCVPITYFIDDERSENN